MTAPEDGLREACVHDMTWNWCRVHRRSFTDCHALRSTPAAPEDGLRVVEVYSGGDSDGNGEADLSVTLDAINADWLTDYLNGINAGFVFNRPVTLRSTPATPHRIQSVYTAIRAGIVNATTLPRNTDVVTWAVIKAAFMADAAAPAAPRDHAADCRSMATKANGDCTCGYLTPATPQPDTALTVERLARALHFHDFGKYPSIVPCGHIGDAATILRALGEGVES